MPMFARLLSRSQAVVVSFLSSLQIHPLFTLYDKGTLDIIQQLESENIALRSRNTDLLAILDEIQAYANEQKRVLEWKNTDLTRRINDTRHLLFWSFSLAMRLAARFTFSVGVVQSLDRDANDDDNYYAVIELPSGQVWIALDRRMISIMDDMPIWEPCRLDALDMQGRQDRMRSPFGSSPSIFFNIEAGHRVDTQVIPSLVAQQQFAQGDTPSHLPVVPPVTQLKRGKRPYRPKPSLQPLEEEK